jgi:hypothetical protein
MNPGIQMLELAIGIKDSLLAAGFTSLDSLLRSSPTELATILGIEFYVAKIIVDAARRAAGRGENGDSLATIPAD